MTANDSNALELILAELRRLRDAVEGIEKHLNRKTSAEPTGKRTRRANMSDDELRNRYREIVDEYKRDRTTRRLDELLSEPRPNLTRFASVNNLPVSTKGGKASIREQILARVREEEQLTATYGMGSRSP